MSEQTKLNENQESKGLGDTIAKITNAVGLDKVAENVAKAVGKEDCGCNKRREKLNELVPFKKSENIPLVPLPATFVIKRSLSIQVDSELVKYIKEEKVYITEDHPIAPSLNYFMKIGAIEVLSKT